VPDALPLRHRDARASTSRSAHRRPPAEQHVQSAATARTSSRRERTDSAAREFEEAAARAADVELESETKLPCGRRTLVGIEHMPLVFAARALGRERLR